MKKLSVYQYWYLSISETFVYRQLQGLAREFDLDIFTFKLLNLDIYPDFKPAVIPRRTLWEKFDKKSREMTFSPKQRCFIMDHLKGSSLLHVNFGHMAMGLQEVSREAKVPMTCFFYGVDASAMLRDPDYVTAYARADFAAVFTMSNDMKERLSPYLAPNTKVFVNHVGIPIKKFPFRKREKIQKGATFLQISRLDKKKGFDVTINVFKRYLDECDPGAKLVIAGDGPLRAKLESQVENLNIQGKVIFLGTVHHTKVIELLNEADVFLQHSVTAPDGDMEGTPIIIEEAMACGLPVISTYHSGIPELIQDEVNGFLVKENDEGAYFEKMAALSSADIERISLNARRQIEENFDAEQTNHQLCSYLKSVIT